MSRRAATLIGFTAVLMWALLALMSAASGKVPPFQLAAMTFLIGGLSLFSVGWVFLLLAPSLAAPWSYMLFVLLGATGTSFTLLWACAKDACPPQYAGMSTSVVNAAQFLGVGAVVALLLGDADQRAELLAAAQIPAVAGQHRAFDVVVGPARLGIHAARAQRDTVFGFTRKIRATSPGVNSTSPSNSAPSIISTPVRRFDLRRRHRVAVHRVSRDRRSRE